MTCVYQKENISVAVFFLEYSCFDEEKNLPFEKY
jgi:hypothetical protein